MNLEQLNEAIKANPSLLLVYPVGTLVKQLADYIGEDGYKPSRIHADVLVITKYDEYSHQYAISGNAWFDHAGLEFVSLPTKESVEMARKIQSGEDEYET